MEDKRAYTEKEAAIYLGVVPSTLRRARMEGIRKARFESPPYIRVGRTIRYLKDDLDLWLEQHRIVQVEPKQF